ncbi:hypothetical protein KAT72_07335 [Aeromonas popoffii]|uniref:Chemotaxis protein n=1 Tax=Aeromonas popoffii TaxID=70856 RepID=A0ABS5GNZ7_9GAMM|nr:hypothetical protein [Aeromonas popoffii]MBR7628850.1 hypothetical protein [Aeromonas popoffii]
MATPLPICLKYEDSPKGGCVVKCKGVCLQRPIYNRQGPVYTTGEACSISSGNPEGSGKGSGDGDGGPDAPASGNSGSTAFPGWYNFEPVIGDATGTSVSGAVAKLNKNLGSAFAMLAGNADLTYSAVSDISGMSRRVVNASEAAQQFLKEISEYNRVANSMMEGMNLVASRSEAYLEQSNTYMGAILDKIGSNSDSTGGNGNNGGEAPIDYSFSLNRLANSLSSLEGTALRIANNTNNQWGQLYTISQNTQNAANYTMEMLRGIASIEDLLRSGSGSGGDGNGSGGGGGGGVDIDYSKMPGSESTPLFVRGASYDSKGCEGGANCFFDVPTVQGKLDEANNALISGYKAIGEDMKRIFSFNFYGSAEPMKCLDLFSLYGKDYSVCPPSADFWSTLAALMMFIFYFVALMVIFKR